MAEENKRTFDCARHIRLQAAAYNPDVTKRFDVCVQGAGVVGKALALALSRLGFSVALVQAGASAATQQREDVRAYALNAGSLALLAELKVWETLPAQGAATPVLDMRIAGDSSGHLEFSAWEQRVRELAWIVDASALEQELSTALRFAPHVSVVGEPTPAELLAVCEGRASATREALGAGFEQHDYGQTAVAARLVAQRAHLGVAWQWFRSPDVLALLPFDRPEPGQSYGLVWSVPTARAQELLAMEASAFEAVLNEATGGAPGALRLGSQRAAWPLQIGRAQRWCGPGWVLLGDAAHVVHPLAGQGLNLGLADVAALVRVLAARQRSEPWRSLGDEKLLSRYARERLSPTWAMAQVTDGLLHLFAQPGLPLRELRNNGLTLVHHLKPLKRWLASRALES